MFILEKDLKFPEENFLNMVNQPYEMKGAFSKKRVYQWWKHYNGMVYVSFSGGLDSCVLAYIVCRAMMEYDLKRYEYNEKTDDYIEKRDVHLVFSNTGLEFPEIRKHTVFFTEWLQKEFPELEIVREAIRPKMKFKEVVKKYGFPLVSKNVTLIVHKLRHGNLSPKYRNYLLNGDERGKFGKLAEKWKFLINAPFDINNTCCEKMKHEPMRRYQKKTGRYPIIGVTQDESMWRKRTYNKTGCNDYNSKANPQSKPIGFWNKQEVLRYAYEHHIPICSVYGDIVCRNGIWDTTREKRTGCMACGFGCDQECEPNRFQRMQTMYPKHYKYFMNEIKNNGYSLREALEYMGIPYETWESVGQMNLFDYAGEKVHENETNFV